MPVEEQVVVDLRRHPRLPRRHPGRATSAASRPSCSTGSAPATPTCSTAIRDTGDIDDEDAFEAAIKAFTDQFGGRRAPPARRPPQAQADAEPTIVTAAGHLPEDEVTCAEDEADARPEPGRRGVDACQAAQERVLRRRIKSVQTTKKITRAMELIAATRVVKAQTARQRGPALQPSRSPR